MIKEEKPFDKNIPTSEQFKAKELNANLESEKSNWISLLNEIIVILNSSTTFLEKCQESRLGY
ncbi:hypothetical protein APR41_06200 [Salegentibacter salinarum]|uniref:Uncharacterized protein n=1 Tax=Salegentibacter salinarum TaxID=447422 RepID=A0A2N0TQK6_9FLAO|nr:hypothetical protein [Salegentibacter salinarum]PKD17024.1 hypothetical protein APR41_06200 [Salegentibacter salinarum]SKB53967.1 hypothetical protein SAMN05660903_01263 [Salegentibacter salinarum]